MLQVSMVGYKTQVINIRGKERIDVTLLEDTQVMEEVVVVGYGTMKKRDLSGSISQIKSEELLQGGQTNVAMGLQGKIAGVDVKQSDGAPGSGVSVTVRGANSFTTSSQPLYIVDGIPFGTDPNGVPASAANEGQNQSQNPLSMLNPNDIEKIEVLKDASATAIYGSRGANGVVIITTRKGQQGKPKVEVGIKAGIHQVTKKIPMLAPYTYALYRNEQVDNDRTYMGKTEEEYIYRGIWNGNEYEPSPEDFLNPRVVTNPVTGAQSEIAVANWQDEIFRLSSEQEYYANISGGTDKGYYAFSGSYTKQMGVVKNSGYEKFNLSVNTAWHLTKWLEIGTSQYFTYAVSDFQRTNSESQNIIRSALLFSPTYGVHTATEQLDALNWFAANPMYYVNGTKDQLKQLSWWSSNFLEFQIQPWLKLRQNIGLGYNDGHRGTYYNRHTYEGRSPINGKAGKASNIWKSLTLETLLTFDHKFNENHSINAVLGATFERGEGASESMTVTNFPNDLSMDAYMDMATDRPDITSSQTKQSLASFLARVNYTLMGRYLFTASARVDGSSSFAKNHKWAPFFSGAFAWRMVDEPWMQDQEVLSNWKWRVSYGQTGNQAIGAYRTLTILNAANYPYNASLESGVATIDWRGPANPDLKWETTDQFDAGLDIGFLNNRLNLTIDYYYKRTRDLLQNVTIPASSGYTQMLVNSGYVTNQGFELTLGAELIDLNDWKWHVDVNFSLNRNRVGGLSGDQYATALWSKADQVFLQRNGCPIGTLYGYVEDGFYNSIDEVRLNKSYAALSDAEALKYVGEIRYKDLNGDGYVTADDRAIIGNTNPDFTGSLASTLSWKGLSLSFMFTGSYGNDILNYNLHEVMMEKHPNITQHAYDTRWTAERVANGQTILYPKATNDNFRNMLPSNRWVENGSFLKMKYLTLAYDWYISAKWIEKINFSFTVNNVFTATKYSWYDPEVNAGGTNAACPGVDSYSYPSSRAYMFAVNFTF